ncbi:hypothetical protein BJ742DRAFT_578057 [Cladochytrium replicatum]|nr:hypothetical protein BJ742DRAFT_578057 [Cladochytrium replicatum]
MGSALDVYDREIEALNHEQCYSADWLAPMPATSGANTFQLLSSPDDIATPFSDTSTLSSVSANFSPIQLFQWPMIQSLESTPVQSTATNFVDFGSDLEGQRNLDEAFLYQWPGTSVNNENANSTSAPELDTFMQFLSLNSSTPSLILPESQPFPSVFPEIQQLPLPYAPPELPPPIIPLPPPLPHKPQLKQQQDDDDDPKSLFFADLPDSFVSDVLADTSPHAAFDSDRHVSLTIAQLSDLLRTAAATTSSPSSFTSPLPDSPVDDPRRRRKPKTWYACEHCDAKFTRRYNYTTHLETHKKDRERSFVCPVHGCGSAFHRANERDRHMAGKHGVVVEKKGDRSGTVYKSG